MMEEGSEGQRPRELGPDDREAEQEADPCQDEAGKQHRPTESGSGKSPAAKVLAVPGCTR